MRRADVPTLAMRGLLLAFICAVARYGTAATATGAALRAISVSSSGPATQLQLRIEGDFTYQTLFATPDTLFIDVTNATANRVAKSGEWSGGVLTSYRLVQFTDAAHRPVVRVHVEMRHHEAFHADRNDGGLLITFGDASTAASAPATPPAKINPPAAETASVAEKSQAAKAPAGPVEVSALFVSAGPDGAVHVDVDTTQPAPYHVVRLENPKRLVVDLNGARKAFHQSAFAVPSGLANGVRVGQFQAKNPAVVRVVVDLSGDPIFDVHARPGGIRIELKPRLAASHTASPAVNTSVPATANVETPKPAQENSQPAPLEASASATKPAAPAPPDVVKREHAAVESTTVVATHTDYQKALPAETGTKSVAATPTFASTEPAPEAVAAANAAKVIAESAPASVVPSRPEVQGGGQTAGASAGAEQPHYSGEPISVNLKDVDLKDFFRLIHEISGLNIIVDPDVNGTVTLVLDNVPWDQALDIVMKDNGLGKTLEGNVLRISKMSTLTAEQEVVSKLASAQTASQPLVTRFIPLSYAKATDVATLIKTVAGGGALSSRGTAVMDTRTNTLIVTDVASQIPVVAEFIQKLDTKAKQVSIEARIIVATKHFERDLSSALNNGWVNKSSSTVTGAATGANASAQGNIPTTTSTSSTTPRVTLGQGNVSGFGAFVINNQGARYFINAMISAAEDREDAKTISNPMIITQNNTLGTIIQGVQIPIQTSINLTVTIQYVNAALTMSVTPQVTSDGNVFLNINVNNASVGAIFSQTGPSINTASATTQVLVPDGGTVVFGGITLQSENKSAQYIPWIGQIPVLGHLFKNTQHITDNNELLFFVTPKILPG